MIVQLIVFEFDCIRFFQECFLEENYFRLVAGQNVLLLEFILMDWGYIPFLFLVLFDSSVSILSRRLNLLLVSAVNQTERVDTFSCSRPVDDGHDPFWIIRSVYVCYNSARGLGYLI